jgi:ribosomal protein S3AE
MVKVIFMRLETKMPNQRKPKTIEVATQEEFNEIMDGYYDAMNKMVEAEEMAMQDFCRELEKIVSTRMYKDVIAYIRECASEGYPIREAEIVKTHGGKEQEEEEYLFKKIYISQSNGGYLGDDYSGTIWIPLGRVKFASLSY